MDITILGNNSALPNHDRFPTAQVVRIGAENFLVDCGEGTQVRLQRHGVKISKITKVFISHLHGDHYFGLIGLLTRLSLNNHSSKLDIYAPRQLQDILNIQFAASNTRLSYEIEYHVLEGEQVLIDNDDYQVSCFPTDHRIECYGFTFIEKPSKKVRLNIDACEKLGIPENFYPLIAQGQHYVAQDGTVIDNHQLIRIDDKRKKYSYCADTRYTETFLAHVSQSDLIYHETTYLNVERQLAFERFHSTTVDAAQIALLSESKKLLIGHFSSKYKFLDQFLEECREIYPQTYLSYEGQNIKL